VLLRRQQELCSPPENYVYAGAPRLSATHTELSYKNEHNPTPSGTLRTHPSPCGSRCATITNVVSGNSARSSDMTSFSVSRSSALMASSRNAQSGLASISRTSASRCCSPTERATAPARLLAEGEEPNSRDRTGVMAAEFRGWQHKRNFVLLRRTTDQQSSCS
jgi:hypothetical protein